MCQEQLPSIYSFSLLNGIILSSSNLQSFGLFLFITAPMACLSEAPCSSSPDVDAVSPRGFLPSLGCLCKTSVRGFLGASLDFYRCLYCRSDRLHSLYPKRIYSPSGVYKEIIVSKGNSIIEKSHSRRYRGFFFRFITLIILI